MITGPMYVQVVAGRFDRLNDAIFDPLVLVDRLDLDRFEGRNELIARIDERIATQDRGYVVIQGEAGVGKSTLAGHLVWTRPCAYHFTLLEGGARVPAEARKSLAAQLIGGWGLSARYTPGDVFPAGADRPDWLLKVIRAAAIERDRRDPQRQPLVLIVDGLDEAEPDPPGMGTGIPLGLPAPDALPAGVYIVATTRYGLPMPALRDPLRVSWSQIDIEGENNLTDMAAYLSAALTGPTADLELVKALRQHAVPAEPFAATLMDRCHGVWIYLRYVLDEIRDGQRLPTDVASLPDRLRGYYEMQIGRWSLSSRAWHQVHLPVLAALAALQRSATSEELAVIVLNGTQRSVSAELIAEWLEGPARAFLDVTATPGSHHHYRIRHQSLRDLFGGPSASNGTAEAADAGLGGRLRRAWMVANRAIAVWLTPTLISGSRDWASIDAYAKLQLPNHAAVGGVLDSLMADPGFLLACPPPQILRHRGALTTPAALTAAGALEAASSDWAVLPSGTDRAWWLHVWARKCRATELVDALLDSESAWSWRVESALWSGTPHLVLAGHADTVNAVAVMQDRNGRCRIVSGGGDRLRVWDPETGAEEVGLIEQTGTISALAVLPGGSRIVVAGAAGLQVWDMASRTREIEFKTRFNWIRSVAILEGPGSCYRIVSAGWFLTIADMETRVERVLVGHGGRVNAVAVLQGTNRIVTGSDDGLVRVWNPDDGTVEAVLAGHVGAVSAVAAVPYEDGCQRIVSGGADGTMRVWDLDTGAHKSIPTGHVGGVSAVAVLNDLDERRCVVTGGINTLRVWDVDTGVQMVELTGALGGVSAIAVLPSANGWHRVVSSGGEWVRVWNFKPSTPWPEQAGHYDSVNAVAILPGPHGLPRVVSGAGDGTVRVWNPNTGLQEIVMALQPDWVWSLAVWSGADGREEVVAGCSDGLVRVWDPETGSQKAEIVGHRGSVRSVAVMPTEDGLYCIVSCGDDGLVRVWDASTGAQRAEFVGHAGPVNAVAVIASRDDRYRIVSGGDDGSLRVWNPFTNIQEAKLVGHTGLVRAIAVLPGGRVVSGGSEGSVRVWDLETGSEECQLRGHRGWVRSVAVLPGADGRHRIVSGGDESVRVWDLETGVEECQLRGHRGWVRSVAVLPGADGRHRIVSSGQDHSVLVWAASS
ncbi:hypothetical protein [Micromonospora taraxaci]